MIVTDRHLNNMMTDEKVNAASVDLSTKLDAAIVLKPGKSVLLSTRDSVDFSAGWNAGLLLLRTSSFRKGLALASPGWVDPGYHGTLTFRVINVTEEDITISDGDRLVQIVVFELDYKPDALYDGRYQGSTETTGYIPEE